jgi:AraC-like DNA-binding protein
VVTIEHYDSAIRLLVIFAAHLATVSNQIMTLATTSELPAMTRARTFITENQGEDIHLRDVASAVNMSEFYFCKLFKRSTGFTFTNYLTRVRIEAVKQMLLQVHLRVSEAAFAAGFQSLSQFNRSFHQVEGESPTEFRERLRGAAFVMLPQHDERAGPQRVPGNRLSLCPPVLSPSRSP